MLIALLLAAQILDDDAHWQQLRDRVELAPQDVATFIERRTSCNHWDGEVGSEEPGRERQVQAERKKLRCNQIDTDERALRHRHRGQRELLRLLDETEDLPPW